jgi:hypothetical protein
MLAVSYAAVRARDTRGLLPRVVGAASSDRAEPLSACSATVRLGSPSISGRHIRTQVGTRASQCGCFACQRCGRRLQRPEPPKTLTHVHGLPGAGVTAARCGRPCRAVRGAADDDASAGASQLGQTVRRVGLLQTTQAPASLSAGGRPIIRHSSLRVILAPTSLVGLQSHAPFNNRGCVHVGWCRRRIIRFPRSPWRRQ